MIEAVLAGLDHPILIFLAVALLPLAGFPVAALWILAGSVMGAPMGIAISIVGLATNITIAYQISHFAENFKWVKKYYDLINDKISSSKIDYVDTILIVRTMPGVPLFVQNYFLGSIDVPFRHYMMLSLAVQSCYAISFVLIGASLRESNWLTSTLVLGGVVLLSLLLRRIVRLRTA